MLRRDFISFIGLGCSHSLVEPHLSRGVTIIGTPLTEKKHAVTEAELIELAKEYGFERIERIFDDFDPPIPAQELFAIELQHFNEDVYRLLEAMKSTPIPTVTKQFPRLPSTPVHSHRYSNFYRSRPRSHL